MFSFQIKAFRSISVLVWLIATTAEKNVKCFSMAHVISAFISQDPEGLIFPFILSKRVRNTFVISLEPSQVKCSAI